MSADAFAPRRRLLRAGGASLALLAAALAGCGSVPRPGTHYLVSPDQLQRALADKPPASYPLGGLVDLKARVDRVRLLPERDRLAAEVAFEATGPLLPRGASGGFDLLFALRYEPSDRTLRAHQLQVQSARLPGLPAPAAAPVEKALPGLARLVMKDELVVYRVQPAELDKLARLGLQPGGVAVTADGVRIDLVPLAAR